MVRLLILIVLIVAAVWLVRRALRRVASQGDMPSAPRTQAADELVRCAHCSVLLPRAEARMSGGTIYCSEEHARLGPGSR